MTMENLLPLNVHFELLFSCSPRTTDIVFDRPLWKSLKLFELFKCDISMLLRANKRGESGACDCGGFVAKFGISMFNLNLVADAPMFIAEPDELCRGSLTGGCCCGLDCAGSWTSSAECCFLGMAVV